MILFQVADRGNPVCMVRLDSQALQVKWQILLKKIKQVRKTMDKDDKNICKKVLLAGIQTCDKGDLLKECITWCKTLDVRCVSEGTDPTQAGAKVDDFKFKKGLWAKNDKEIRVALDKLKKVKKEKETI